MKSAYEIAMERLQQEHGPTKSLTDAQRARIAEINAKFDAKTAEARLGFEAKMKGASSIEEYEKMQADQAAALGDIEEQREREKDAVWNETA